MSADNLAFASSTEYIIRTKEIPSSSVSKLQGRKNSPIDQIGDVSLELENRHGNERSRTSDADYEPYDHRGIEHPTTTWETTLHLMKGSLGTGILAMPNAFFHSGWLMGIIGTMIIGFLCTYCIRILIRSSYEMCKRRRVPTMSYPETAKAALLEGPAFFKFFANSSPHIINAFLLIYQLGTCCVYTVFIAVHLKGVGDYYIGDHIVKLYILAILFPLIFINWIRNLKFLAPLSTLANAATVISFGIIAYYLFFPVGTLSTADKPQFGKPEHLPLFFGTVLFALEAIGIILPLVNEMEKPKSFKAPFGVLNVGMASITLLYVAMGFFGYIRFGDKVGGSIVLNLPKEAIPAQIALILLSFAIFVTHALQFYVAIEITWNVYVGKRIKESYQVIGEYAIRTLLVVATACLAAAIPRIDKLIDLFGALCLSALGLSFPAMIEICAFWSVQNKNQNSIMLTKNIFLILFGLFGFIVGTFTSILNIIHEK